MVNIKVQTSSDIECSKYFTIDDFNKFVKGFDLVGSLMLLQKMSARMADQIHVTANIEFEFHSSPKVKLKAGTITRDFMTFVAKQVLLNCEKKEIQFNEIDLLYLMYMYDNLKVDLHKIKADGETKGKDGLYAIRSTNHQWCYRKLPSHVLARYHWLFSKIFEQNTALGKKLDQTLGIEVFKVMKIGVCIYANFSPRDDGKIVESFLMSSCTETTEESLKPLLTEENMLKFFGIFAARPEQFREECKQYDLADTSLKKYEFNSLKRFPVIKTESKNKNEQIIIPSLPDFVYGFSEGLYYVLLDQLDSNNRDTFLKEIGVVFEGYIGEFIRQYHIDALSRAQVFSEKTYRIGGSEWRSADWILVSEEYIFQIECKKRKMDVYSRAGIQSEDAGIDTLLVDIAKTVDKIVAKEGHLKENKVDGICYENQKVINIIVFLDEMFSVNQYAREEIKNNMKIKSDNFHVLGCWEFELVCQQSKNERQDLYHSIEDVVNGKAKIDCVDFLDRAFRSFVDGLTAEG